MEAASVFRLVKERCTPTCFDRGHRATVGSESESEMGETGKRLREPKIKTSGGGLCG